MIDKPPTIHTLTWAEDITSDLMRAEKIISISALSFLPPRNHRPDAFGAFYSALLAAVIRRVKVVVILPAPTNSHPATAQNATAAGKLAASGMFPTLRHSTNLLHAKTVQIDYNIAWIGSGNMTAAAAHFNREAWMRSQHKTTARDLAMYHDYLIKTAEG